MALQLALYLLVAGAGLRGARWRGGGRGPRRTTALLLGAAGAAMVVGGSIDLGAALTPNPRPRTGAGLRDRGLYRRVRHPIYGGVILGSLAWSLWLSPTALAPTALTAVFVDLKSRREEAWLEERYPGYASYRSRVRRRFLPLLW